MKTRSKGISSLVLAMISQFFGSASAQLTNVFVDTPYYSYLYNIGATSAPDPYTQTKDTAYAFLQVVGHDAGNVVRDVPPPVTV